MDTFMSFLPGIVMIIGVQALALISPGASVFVVANTALENGRKAAIYVALGVAVGSFIWAALAIFGVSAFSVRYPVILYALQFLGGCYFLYLSAKTLFQLRQITTSAQTAMKFQNGFSWIGWRYALHGMMIQIGNPKVIFVWIGLGILGIEAGAPLWVPVSVVVLAFLNSAFVNGLYAVLFSMPRVMRVYLSFQKPVKLMFGIAFTAIGLKLLIDLVP